MNKLFLVANWKMNGNKDSNEKLINFINNSVNKNINIEVVICPPFTYLNQILRQLWLLTTLTKLFIWVINAV